MYRLVASLGRKLVWGVGLPALAVGLLTVLVFWRRTDEVVRDASRREAAALAELVANSFSVIDGAAPGTPHRAVTQLLRTEWKSMRHVSELRVIDRSGVVRWSRRVEDEGRAAPDAERLLSTKPDTIEGGLLSARSEVVRPLGGVACGGCHAGEAAMKVGVLQLTTDESSVRREALGVLRYAVLGLLTFSLVLALATGLSLRLFITRRLRRLSLVMQRAEEGDFLARAPVEGSDEIGDLAEAFNRMLKKITSMKADEIDTHRDLEAAHSELALKKALEEANVELSSRLRELSTLYDIGRSLTSTLELPELLKRIASIVPERLQIPKFSIMLLDAEGKLVVRSTNPTGEAAEGMTFDIGEGACGRAAQTLKSVYIPDLETDAGIYKRHTPGANRGALLAVPMIHGGTLLGVINFERPERASFSAEEIEFLTAVADQAAMAAMNAQLHHQTVELSLTDPLTGVPNRRHLFARLELEIARANRFGTQLSLLMVDIDHFKHLNDAAGHRAGDVVLRQVCDLMRGVVRRVDTLARYGGEEFVLLLPQVTKTEALEVADKVRRLVEESPLDHANVQPGGKITISVGVANLPVDATEQDRLVDCADSALYASKRDGRNRATPYAPGMELHPGRERGPHAQRKVKSGEAPAVSSKR